MRFKVVLSEKGKEVYKGGNIPVMKPMLKDIRAKNLRDAEAIFYGRIQATLGSANRYLFDVKKI
jgi:hypothetical protein